MQLCDRTCASVTTDTKGSVSILVGCATQVAAIM